MVANRIMRVIISILLLYQATVLPFDLHNSMDETRSAIESFYNDSQIELKGRLEKLETLKSLEVETTFRHLFFSKTLITASNVINLEKSIKQTDSDIFKLKLAMKNSNSNKFAQAIHDIEKALADAQVFHHIKHNEQRLTKLRLLTKTAVEKRSHRFARKCIGEAMMTIHKMNEQQKRGRGKRNAAFISSKDFLRNVKQTIGESNFRDLLAMEGEVTLMFAIDDTGSMWEEIDEAKKIAKLIIDHNRTLPPVEYILSPFNDPGNISYIIVFIF